MAARTTLVGGVFITLCSLSLSLTNALTEIDFTFTQCDCDTLVNISPTLLLSSNSAFNATIFPSQSSQHLFLECISPSASFDDFPEHQGVILTRTTASLVSRDTFLSIGMLSEQINEDIAYYFAFVVSLPESGAQVALSSIDLLSFNVSQDELPLPEMSVIINPTTSTLVFDLFIESASAFRRIILPTDQFEVESPIIFVSGRIDASTFFLCLQKISQNEWICEYVTVTIDAGTTAAFDAIETIPALLFSSDEAISTGFEIIVNSFSYDEITTSSSADLKQESDLIDAFLDPLRTKLKRSLASIPLPAEPLNFEIKSIDAFEVENIFETLFPLVDGTDANDISIQLVDGIGMNGTLTQAGSALQGFKYVPPPVPFTKAFAQDGAVDDFSIDLSSSNCVLPFRVIVLVEENLFDLPINETVNIIISEGDFLEFTFYNESSPLFFGASIVDDTLPDDFKVKFLALPEPSNAFLETRDSITNSLVTISTEDKLSSNESDIFITPARPKFFNYHNGTQTCNKGSFGSCAITFEYALIYNDTIEGRGEIASDNVLVNVFVEAIENDVLSITGPSSFLSNQKKINLTDLTSNYLVLYDFGENVFSITLNIYLPVEVEVESLFGSTSNLNSSDCFVDASTEKALCLALIMHGLPDEINAALKNVVFVQSGTETTLLFEAIGKNADASKRTVWAIRPETNAPVISSTSSPTPSSSSNRTGIIVGVVVPVVLLLIAAIIFGVWYYRKHNDILDGRLLDMGRGNTMW